MSTGNDWFRSLLAVPDEEETPEVVPPPDFDGGARTTPPAPPPSMNTLIRRARFGGDMAGTQHPTSDDAA